MKQFFSRFINFIKKHRGLILKVLLMLAALAIVSVVAFLLLMAFDVIYYDDGIQFDAHIFNTFTSSWYGWIIFILLQTGLSILLCIIPGATMAFILLSKTIYPVAWQAFLLSFISVMISSSIMYAIGRFGGYRICEKMLGKEDCEKSLSLLRDKGTVFFPLMMMFPIFPDDALVMIAGTLKMSLKWFIPSIIVGRGIGIATIIFGLSLTSYLTKPWHRVLFVILAVVFVILLFYFANKFNKYLNCRRNKEQSEETVNNT